MKTFLFALAATTLAALGQKNGAAAQSNSNLAVLEHPTSIVKVDKLMPLESETLNMNAVNAKAVKNFSKTYKTVSGEKWVKNQYGVTAHFDLNGINNVIYYDKKGNWEASLKTYNEDQFNPKVRAIVKSKYFDYKITQVQEIEDVNTDGTPTYIVHIEDENSFKLIRVSDGNMDVYEDYAKQK